MRKPESPRSKPRSLVPRLSVPSLSLPHQINHQVLLAALGAIGVQAAIHGSEVRLLVVPESVTLAQIEAVVSAAPEASATSPDPLVNKVHNWSTLTTADKDTVAQAVAKRVIGG